MKNIYILFGGLFVFFIQAFPSSANTITIVNMPSTKNVLKIYKIPDNQWIDISGNHFINKRAEYPIIQKDSKNNIYVAFLNSSKISVAKFDGNKWTDLEASEGFSASGYYDFKIDNKDRPVIVYQDKKFSNKLTALLFNGTQWQTLGEKGFSSRKSAKAFKIAFDQRNHAHVIYGSFNFKKDSYDIFIQHFDGQIWASDSGFKLQETLNSSPIITDYLIDTSGTHYIACGFQNSSTNHRMKIFSYDTNILKPLININPEYFYPALSVDGKKRIHVLCSSITNKKNSRILNVLELKNKTAEKIAASNQQDLIYSMRSNITPVNSGGFYFLYSNRSPSGDLSISLAGLNDNLIKIQTEKKFKSFSSMTSANILVNNDNIPITAIALFR